MRNAPQGGLRLNLLTAAIVVLVGNGSTAPRAQSPASDNAGASCQRDADCPNGACQVETSFGVCKPDSTTKANKKCSTDADCDGTSGSCVTEQPFQLDGVVTCP